MAVRRGHPGVPPSPRAPREGPTLTSASDRGLWVFLATLVFYGVGGQRVEGSGGDTRVGGDTPG